jgi:outer membrane protein
MKCRISRLIIMTFLLATTCFTAIQAAELPSVSIGIVRDGPWERPEGTLDLFQREITSLAGEQFDIRFVAGQALDGDWTVAGIREKLNRAMADPGIDMVIALGHVATHLACKLEKIEKPVIAPMVIDAKLQMLPRKEGTTGVDRLNYIDRLKSTDRDIQAFMNLVKFRSLALIMDGYIIRSIPELITESRKIASQYAIDVSLISMETSVEAALADLPPGTDAVMINPLFRLNPEGFQTLVEGLIQRRIPSYSFWGRSEVELGILATTTPGNTINHLARSAAVNVLEILDGEKAGNLPVIFTMDQQLTINMATARATNLYPSLSLLTEAELINEEPKDVERVLSIKKAAKEALDANLQLAAAERGVAAGKEAVTESRSPLLPQLDLSTNADVIDDDRALVRGGALPERSWTGTATATQVLYSEEAWSNYTVEKYLQDSRSLDRDTLRLDIIQSAATAYINVLRAKAIERIQKENLKLTRANLQRARVRMEVGAAGPDEVYRWESQIASSRRVVLFTESATLDAMNNLNRILDRPLQEPFSVVDVEDDTIFKMENWYFPELVDNERNLQALKTFLITEGFELSPELMALQAQISARKRVLSASRRNYWMPTFSLSGSVRELFAEEGAGQREDAIIPYDDTDWQVGVQATLPLFEGGRKPATTKRTREELTQLRIQYNYVKNQIEQRILVATNRMRASAPGVQLSREAAETADRNLTLVTDSYSLGTKTIIDLLDAQNLVLVNHQRAANALYGYLADIINMQRAVGQFVMILDKEEQQEWIRKLEDYMMQAGIEPKRG